MDVFDLIKADHRQVEKLFSQIETAKDAAQKYDYFNQLYQELNLHAETEELVFYPAMREYEETQDLVEAAEAEHVEAKELLEEIQYLSPESAEFKHKISQLKQAVQDHVEEEENEIMPKVSQSMNKKELQQLAQEFKQTKSRIQEDMAATA
jgi:hemerythrin superfamily protein